MPNKRVSYELADFKADTRPDHQGEATAIVSVFGNVDLMGDRVVKGAFEKSLAQWEESGSPIPVYWSHDWANPKTNIGEVTNAAEVDRGLQVDMKFDIADNENAAYVFKLLRTRRVKEFSFAYQIEGERKGKDGANELTDLRILEVGPTFKGANPETELLDVKAGARLSSATKSEMQGIHDGMNELTARMRNLMGTASEDTPKLDDEADTKSEDDEPQPAKSDEQPDEEPLTAKSDETPELDELLALQLRIEEMRRP